VILTFGPAVFDSDIPTLNKTQFTKTIVEKWEKVRDPSGRFAAKESDHRHCGLLRARSERPRCRRAAEKRDERAPLHHVEHRPSYAVGLPQAQPATNWAESPVIVAAGGYSPADSEQYRSTPRTPLCNRQFGPTIVRELAEQRAPQGFSNIEEVISRCELVEIAAAYKAEGGFDPTELNQRRTLTVTRAISSRS
jgi:hypothetical protein